MEFEENKFANVWLAIYAWESAMAGEQALHYSRKVEEEIQKLIDKETKDETHQ